MNVSVCMATYNGQDYISEQINSILPQLNRDDEIIIVDDYSTDNTISILRSIQDSRIKLFYNSKNRGYIFTFSKALSLSKNDIVFLSDQDDIWIQGRVKLMTQKLYEAGTLVITSNFNLLFSNGQIESEPFGKLKSVDSTKYVRNIIGIFRGNMNYFGCTMAIKRELLTVILPIPFFVRSHDLWIAMAGNLLSSNLHMDEITLVRRIHISNATNPNRSIVNKLMTRFEFVVSIVCLVMRKRKMKN